MNDQNEPIIRNRVFVLLDGVFVLKIDEHTVEELLTGKQRKYERREFGANITDFELNQLKQAGIVQGFDKEHIRLTPSSQRRRYYQANSQQRLRVYYLHTTLAPDYLSDVASALVELGFEESLVAQLRDDFVVITDEAGGGRYTSFDEIESLRLELGGAFPELFSETVVAFVETNS